MPKFVLTKEAIEEFTTGIWPELREPLRLRLDAVYEQMLHLDQTPARLRQLQGEGQAIREFMMKAPDILEIRRKKQEAERQKGENRG